MVTKRIHDAGEKIVRDMHVEFYAHGCSISIDKFPQTIVLDLSNDKITIHIADRDGIEGPPIGVVKLKSK